MKCIIPGINIKVFGKIVHTLARIGTELNLEPTLDGLELKALDDAKSAFSTFLLKPRFFQHYDDGSLISTTSSVTPRYRLAAKACLQIFKSLGTLEKTAERCDIKLSDDKNRIVFVIHSKQGLKKTYNLTYMEAEPLRAHLNSLSFKNTFSLDARLLTDIVEGFSSSVEEIDFKTFNDYIEVRNTLTQDEEDSGVNSIHTVMRLNKDDFEMFDVADPTTICVCLRELKAAANFAACLNLQSTFHFRLSGEPLMVTMDTDTTFTATYILATTPDNDSQDSDSSASSAQTRSTQRSEVTPRSRVNTHKITNTSKLQEKTLRPRSVAQKRDVPAQKRDVPAQKRDVPAHKRDVPAQKRDVPAQKRDVPTTNGSHGVKRAHVNTTNDSTIDVKPRSNLLNDTSISLLPYNGRGDNTASTSKLDTRDELDKLLEEIDNESKIIGSGSEQPNKKMKTLLSHKPSSQPKELDLDEVLAEDSDED